MTTTLPKPRRAARAAVNEPPVQPDTTGQLSDNDMYERMVSAILDHRLPPGTKLVEDKLAAAFGVSRTRVRPVLVRLANEQVVTLTPNRGASIAQPTPQEALEVFEARRLLEPRLVELFIANATDADIAALRCVPVSTTKRPPAPAATCAVRFASRATFTCTLRRPQGTRHWGASCASWSRAPRSS